MNDFDDEWAWRCAGCDTSVKLKMNISARNLQRTSNPARYIAQERLAIERTAANMHAPVCKRPV